MSFVFKFPENDKILRIVDRLFDNNDETNFHEVYGDDILYLAIENAENQNPDLRLSLVKLLLKKGADPSQYSPNGIPLHCAVKHNDIRTIEVLLKNGASINAKNDNKQCALHIVFDFCRALNGMYFKNIQ